MSTLEARSGRRGTWLLLAFSIPVLALLLVLGMWQVQRLQWKEGLIQQIETRINSDAAPLAQIAALQSQGSDIEYRRTQMEGAFDHRRERHYLATYNGQSGFFVYTPLALEDGRSIFVNRGFVPYDRKDPATRPEGQIPGTVQIGGLARKAPEEKPSFIVPENNPEKNIFYWKDLDLMTRSAGLQDEDVYPFFVDANNAPNPGGLPVGGVTRINLPNNHLQYAITWFGLAFALVCVLVYWLLRGRGAGES